ncbi:MAG: hypothetical protein ACTHMX_07900 [Thermomicrobiales bacterium]
MAGKRHTAAFIFGTVAGGLAGAAVALWKTPHTGDELRAAITTVTDPTSTFNTEPRHSSKLLGAVEYVLAPVVGVELGKTANGSGPVPLTPFDAAPVASSDGDTPTVPVETVPAQDVQPAEG